MPIMILGKEKVPQFVEGLLRDYQVIGPRKKDGFYLFGPVSKPEEIALEYPIALYPPRKFFLPAKEPVLRFRLGEKPEVEPVVEPPTPKVLFGLHPCDLHSTRLLDAAFLKENPDANYETRRRNAIFVGIDCLAPCDEYAFCKDMGTLDPKGYYDLFLTDLGEAYAVEIGSGRGEELLRKYSAAREATKAEQSKLEEVRKERDKNFPSRLKFDASKLPEILWSRFNSPYWGELAKRCMGCGSCTLVCSTCYCHDVLDRVELNLTEGERIRVWDSCLLDEFAKVAGGLNFRPSLEQRLRHRFYRKGKYLWDLLGLPGCVGCGRCTRHCLAKINPIEVFNDVYQEYSQA